MYDAISEDNCTFCVANIVNIEAESFSQVIKPVKLELVVQPYPHVPFFFK